MSDAAPRIAIEVFVYQVQALIERLEPFQSSDYPAEARQIAHLIASLAEYIRSQLESLADSEGLLVERDYSRAQNLQRIARELYEFLRYIQASESRYTPPSVQATLTALTQRYFPSDRGTPLALVRPQWAYNLKYVPLSWSLREKVQLDILDPENSLGLIDPTRKRHEVADRFLELVWKKRYDALAQSERPDDLDPTPPRQLAVLSFAGLDRDVTLQFPILAHELGHFIDHSQHPFHHQDRRIIEACYIGPQVLEEALGTAIKEDELEAYLSLLTERISVCVREILADLLATRMLGLGFFLAQAEFLTRIFAWPQTRVTRSGYPGIAYRVTIILDELRSLDPGEEFSLLRQHDALGGREGEIAAWTREHLAAWDTRVKDLPPLSDPEPGSSASEVLDSLAAKAVETALPEIKKVAAELLPAERAASLSRSFFERVFALEQDLPPVVERDDSDAFGEIMAAAWVYQLMYGQARERKEPTTSSRIEEFNKTSRLVLKAVELASTAREVLPPAEPIAKTSAAEPKSYRGVLTAGDLRDRLAIRQPPEKRLVIFPADPQAVQEASVDVRLGHWFKVARSPRLATIDVTTKKSRQRAMRLAHDEMFIPAGGNLIIHPGDFVLGTTLEFIALPDDLMAFVEGRSSIGRTGLIVATATQVAPGFHGCVVLELANAGRVPLTVGPGTPIAQLVILGTSSPANRYRGPSHCQIKP